MRKLGTGAALAALALAACGDTPRPFAHDQAEAIARLLERFDALPDGHPLSVGTTLTLEYERYKTTTGFVAGIFTGGVRIPLK